MKDFVEDLAHTVGKHRNESNLKAMAGELETFASGLRKQDAANNEGVVIDVFMTPEGYRVKTDDGVSHVVSGNLMSAAGVMSPRGQLINYRYLWLDGPGDVATEVVRMWEPAPQPVEAPPPVEIMSGTATLGDPNAPPAPPALVVPPSHPLAGESGVVVNKPLTSDDSIVETNVGTSGSSPPAKKPKK